METIVLPGRVQSGPAGSGRGPTRQRRFRGTRNVALPSSRVLGGGRGWRDAFPVRIRRRPVGGVVSLRSSWTEDSEAEPAAASPAQARRQLEALLNQTLRIRMTDGRSLVGCFLCTDRDCNVILGSAQEFLKPSDSFSAGEPRVLGLAMVPGHHIVSIEVQRDSLAPGPPRL